MKLYFFPIAPNPTKVRLYLAEKREAGVAASHRRSVLSSEALRTCAPSGENAQSRSQSAQTFELLGPQAGPLELQPFLGDQLSLAADNGPSLTVASGPSSAIDALAVTQGPGLIGSLLVGVAFAKAAAAALGRPIVRCHTHSTCASAAT